MPKHIGRPMSGLFNDIEILLEKAKDFKIFCYLVLKIWDFCRYLQIFLESIIFSACVCLKSLYISGGLIFHIEIP